MSALAIGVKRGIAGQVSFTDIASGCSLVGTEGMVGATLILSNGSQHHVENFTNFGATFDYKWAIAFFGGK